jgi:hypothetical protein
MSADPAVFMLLHPDAPNVEPRVVGARFDRAGRWKHALGAARESVVAVSASPWGRRRVAAALRAAGCDVTYVLGRGPDGATQFVSLDRDGLRLGFRLAPSGRIPKPVEWASTWRLALKLARVLLPNVLVVAVPGPLAPLHWVSATGAIPARRRRPSFVLTVSPLSDRAYAYIADGADAVVVGKLALSTAGADRVVAEAAALRDIGPTARAAGAVVPEFSHTTRIGGMPTLIESFVGGVPAARLLQSRPQELSTLVARVAAWLTLWAAETAARQAPTTALAPWISQPLGGVANVVSAAFVDALRSDAQRLSGERLVTSAAHNDLTMWNVVVSGDAAIGVLDWESAGTALPLMDLFYVLADAVAATGGYRDRRAAFRACFHADGPRARWARAVVDASARELSLGPDAVALSFRLCWVQHAADDERRDTGEGFAAMLGDLAAAPAAYWPTSGHAG